MAEKRGWRARNVGVLLAVTRTDANERKIRRLPSLFGSFRLRGDAARAWLANPASSARLLIHVRPSEAGRGVWRNSRQRVRARAASRPAANSSRSGLIDGRAT